MRRWVLSLILVIAFAIATDARCLRPERSPADLENVLDRLKEKLGQMKEGIKDILQDVVLIMQALAESLADDAPPKERRFVESHTDMDLHAKIEDVLAELESFLATIGQSGHAVTEAIKYFHILSKELLASILLGGSTLSIGK